MTPSAQQHSLTTQRGFEKSHSPGSQSPVRGGAFAPAIQSSAERAGSSVANGGKMSCWKRSDCDENIMHVSNTALSKSAARLASLLACLLAATGRVFLRFDLR